MKNRKNRRKQKSNKVVVNILFILGLLFIYTLFTNFNLADKQITTNEVVVQSDDTIWNLAKNACKDNENLNVQNVVIEIKKINNLESSNIYVGQVLNIPVY